MIIGIGHKAQVGKDITYKLFAYNILKHEIETGKRKEAPLPSFYDVVKDNSYLIDYYTSSIKNKKFARALKMIVCILTGCSLSDLEILEFKASKMPEEWRVWVIERFVAPGMLETYRYFSKEEDAKKALTDPVNEIIFSYVPTYGEFLQKVGTDLFRINWPQTWINALFAKYSQESKWFITDVRFPNEVQAIKDRGGLLIKVNRDLNLEGRDSKHHSETALDHYTDWHYILDNNGTFEELNAQVLELINKENLYEKLGMQ